MNTVKMGLIGCNGHQLTYSDALNAGVEIIAAYDTGSIQLPESVKICNSVSDLLLQSKVQAVSICSKKRSAQIDDIVAALKAKKHIICEKPCAMHEEEINFAVMLAIKNNVIFTEMNNVSYEQPYAEAKRIIKSGILGETIQIFIQKSYPYADWRAQDEDIDGGIILQNAVYGLRFIQQTAGETIKEISVLQTKKGNPQAGNLQMACSMQLTLESGAIATIIANYLNKSFDGNWANEEMRVFGTKANLNTSLHEKCVYVFTNDKCERIEAPQTENQLAVFAHSVRTGERLAYDAQQLLVTTILAVRAREQFLFKSEE